MAADAKTMLLLLDTIFISQPHKLCAIDDDEDFSPLFQRTCSEAVEQNPIQSIQYFSTMVEVGLFLLFALSGFSRKVSSTEQGDWLNAGKIFFLAQWMAFVIGWWRVYCSHSTNPQPWLLSLRSQFFSKFLKSGVQRKPGLGLCVGGLSSYVLQRRLAAAGETSPSKSHDALFFFSFVLLAARRKGHAVNTPLTVR